MSRFNGNLGDALLVEAKDDPTLQNRRGVIEMHDGVAGPVNRFIRTANQVFPALRQHLDRYVLRNEVFFDDVTNEIKIGL